MSAEARISRVSRKALQIFRRMVGRHPLTARAPCRAKLWRLLSVPVQIVAGRANSLLREFFFLAPRRRSGERIEERGGHLLSLALSSIRWRRGSVALRLSRAATNA